MSPHTRTHTHARLSLPLPGEALGPPSVPPPVGDIVLPGPVQRVAGRHVTGYGRAREDASRRVHTKRWSLWADVRCHERPPHSREEGERTEPPLADAGRPVCSCRCLLPLLGLAAPSLIPAPPAGRGSNCAIVVVSAATMLRNSACVAAACCSAAACCAAAAWCAAVCCAAACSAACCAAAA